jgi:endonuclease VIII
MHPDWDAAQARRKLRLRPRALAADALLDQDVFDDNIIKNEALFRIRVHPQSAVGALPLRKLAELVARRARTASISTAGKRPSCRKT